MRTAIAIASVFIICCTAQRSPYAGRDPIGYPTLVSTEDPLANRFAEDGTPTTTMKLPIEAMGDAELVKWFMQQPIEQRPFWLINWEALQDNRNKPQTWGQRENGFLDWNGN